MGKKKKIRVDLRKNRQNPARQQGWTRRFRDDPADSDQLAGKAHVRARGELSRKRTIMADDDDQDGPARLAVDLATCLPGRVLKVHGTQQVYVADETGALHVCAVRRLLRTMAIAEGNVVVCGDRVWFRQDPTGGSLIEKVEPRYGVLIRSAKGHEQVLVANVDQVVIVVALAEPALKPHLIDRYLVSAAGGGIQPIICLNKADLVQAAQHQALVGLYSQLNIPTFLTSAKTGQGVAELRALVRNRETVFAGQSGVGKSSLLNAIEPGLGLKVSEVSAANQKGRHTTTTAELIRLQDGGWVVDTPGIRQFALRKLIREELDGAFPEFRPHVARCRFPGCTHTHEDGCGVRAALDRGWISTQRYESYLDLFHGRLDE
jgi:ribosome biogenesis GTPase